MKSFFRILCLVFFVWACTPEDEEQQDQGPRNLKLLSLSIPSDYFYEEGTYKYSGHLFLSDQNGEVVDQSELLNNSVAELVMDYDSSEAFDATMVYRAQYQLPEDNLFTFYRIKTFNSVEAGDYEIGSNQNEEIEEGATANIQVENVGGLLEDIMTGTAYSASFNNSELDLELSLSQPMQDIYISLRRENDEKPRYILLQSVSDGFNQSYSFDDLPIAEKEVVVNHPDSDGFNVMIKGALSSKPNNFFAGLTGNTNSFTSNESVHYIPQGLFSVFRQYTNIEIGEKRFSTTAIVDEIDTEYLLPDLDFQVVNDNIETYEISSSSNFDFYAMTIIYNNEAENIGVQWTQYGKSSGDNIKIRLPRILELLDIEDTQVSIDDFEIVNTEISEIDGVETYKDYTRILLDGSMPLITKAGKIQSMAK